MRKWKISLILDKQNQQNKYMGNEDLTRKMQGQRRIICVIFAEDFVGKRVPLVSTFGKKLFYPLCPRAVLAKIETFK